MVESKFSVGFLNIEIDDKLKFNLHIKYICNKVSKNTGIMYRLKDDLATNPLNDLCYSFVYSYLNYCHLI